MTSDYWNITNTLLTTLKQFTCVSIKPQCANRLLIGVYVSPQSSFDNFNQHFESFITHIDTSSTPTIIIGDFNMKSITKKEERYNEWLEHYMQRRINMTQYVNQSTHSSGSVLDLCFFDTTHQHFTYVEPLV